MPRKLADAAQIASIVDAGWMRASDPVVEKRFAFGSYAEAVTFVVRLAFSAERRDHHPDIVLQYGSVTVRWTTHDVGGISDLDIDMARHTDEVFGGGSGGSG
jgi:4a-hydroxytetrahydrobiopterin dehydratase